MMRRRGRCLRHKRCLHGANERVMMYPMDIRATPCDRLVVVPLAALDDLLELVRLASDRIEPTDALSAALRGAAAQVAVAAVSEPS